MIHPQPTTALLLLAPNATTPRVRQVQLLEARLGLWRAQRLGPACESRPTASARCTRAAPARPEAVTLPRGRST